MNRGTHYAIAAYLLWGLSPIYWKLISEIPALEIIAHRIIWAFIFVFLIIFIRRDWFSVKVGLRDRRVRYTFLSSSLLLCINWLVYIWAVNANFIIDTSLGYFINPLVNVVLGVIFLKERLRLGQWVPVGIAVIGVIFLTISYGSLPWIGLTLALTFGTYGLLKKTAPLNSLHGFSIEMGFLIIPALLYIIFLEKNSLGLFVQSSFFQKVLLLSTGLITGLPLLLFGAAARLVPLSKIGFIQYIAPTLQFLIGVLIFGELFSRDQMIGFGLIWIALIIYTIDSISAFRKFNGG